LALFCGCCCPLPDPTDQVVQSLSLHVRDLEPLIPPRLSPPAEAEPEQLKKDPQPVPQQPVHLVQKDKTKPAEPKKQPLFVPRDLPGSDAPAIPLMPKAAADKEKAINKLYPALPPLPPPLQMAPGPEGKPLTLADLQSLATANNPSIKNAVAAVEAARGAAIQAGAYPNPTVAWEADTVGTSGAGYQGAYVDQVIKGANDIRLRKAAATMDLRNAELALRRAQYDLATQVRSNYFAVLVARENAKVSRALAQFAERIYRVQVDLLLGAEAAAYEPMQLRPLVLQARFNLIQATNQFQASWKQLAAALGLPGMPPTELAGRVDLPIPVYSYDEVLTQMLNRHTDVLTARNSLQKARYNLELAQVAPFPDFDVRLLVQKDYTTPPHLLVYSAVVSLQLPVWDLNKGNIIQAKNQLIQAAQQIDQSKLQLINSLADAFNRYTTSREQVDITMQQIRDQIRAFRGLYERYRTEGDVDFGDVVTAQQTLASYITSYVTALGLQWTAVVDLANLLQTDDLFQVGKTQEVDPVPDLESIFPLPGCEPGQRSEVRGQESGVRGQGSQESAGVS
jgi:cobalt-zinc-cadmium efflux system outer membrane protein